MGGIYEWTPRSNVVYVLYGPNWRGKSVEYSCRIEWFPEEFKVLEREHRVELKGARLDVLACGKLLTVNGSGEHKIETDHDLARFKEYNLALLKAAGVTGETLWTASRAKIDPAVRDGVELHLAVACPYLGHTVVYVPSPQFMAARAEAKAERAKISERLKAQRPILKPRPNLDDVVDRLRQKKLE